MELEPHTWQIVTRVGCVLALLIGISVGDMADAQTVEVAKVKHGSARPAAASGVRPTNSEIDWFTEVEPAWQAAQRAGRPLLVYVTCEQCVFCRKMEKQTYVDPAIAAAIDASFVPLSLDGGKPSPLVKDLAVKSYPATFIISPQAVVLDRIDGYVPADQLAKRLAKAAGRKPAGAAAQPVAERKQSSTSRAW